MKYVLGLIAGASTLGITSEVGHCDKTASLRGLRDNDQYFHIRPALPASRADLSLL
jgi:hypothetical protein